MTNLELFGFSGFDSSADDTALNHQLAIFKHSPAAITHRIHFWLSSVASSTAFCGAGSNGYASHWSASNVYGVRPRFLIG